MRTLRLGEQTVRHLSSGKGVPTLLRWIFGKQEITSPMPVPSAGRSDPSQAKTQQQTKKKQVDHTGERREYWCGRIRRTRCQHLKTFPADKIGPVGSYPSVSHCPREIGGTKCHFETPVIYCQLRAKGAYGTLQISCPGEQDLLYAGYQQRIACVKCRLFPAQSLMKLYERVRGLAKIKSICFVLVPFRPKKTQCIYRYVLLVLASTMPAPGGYRAVGSCIP